MNTDRTLVQRLEGLGRVGAASGIAIAAASIFGWLSALPMLVAIQMTAPMAASFIALTWRNADLLGGPWRHHRHL